MGQELVSLNPHGTHPEVREYKDESSEVAGVVGEIVKITSEGIAAQDIAVLARTNSQLSALERGCLTARIPYQVRSNERFFERTDVKDFLRAVRQASVIPTHQVEWLDELRSVAQPFISGASTDGITALLHLARELDADPAFTPKSLRSYLREIEARAEQNNPPVMPVITLATLHAAKGLEWEHVFLVGVSEGILPTNENVVEEERRLFYVGITRAKRHLNLSYRSNPSRFLREAGLLEKVAEK